MQVNTNKNASKGMLTLEACVSVMIFMILMLIFLGLFQMFMAQNVTAHVLLQTAESLSLDSYATSKLKDVDSWTAQIGDHISQFVTQFFGNQSENPYFVSNKAWYEGKEDLKFGDIVRLRFIGYLAEGDDTAADKFLRAMRVVGGLDGLDFSETVIVNGDLKITLKYELEYSFRIWGVKPVGVYQRAVSHLWMDNAVSKNRELE